MGVDEAAMVINVLNERRYLLLTTLKKGQPMTQKQLRGVTGATSIVQKDLKVMERQGIVLSDTCPELRVSGHPVYYTVNTNLLEKAFSQAISDLSIENKVKGKMEEK